MAGASPGRLSPLPQSDEDEYDGPELEVFSEDEELARDTTEVQLAAGRDPQGIPWELTQFTRDGYRAVRNESYHNYFNLEGAVEAAQPRIDAEALQPRPGGRFFDFYRNWRQPRSSIVHFQLRNLLWATSAHDAYIVHENKVQHWNSITRRVTTVMDVSGGVTGAVAPGIGQVQLCTLCAREGLVAGGGFGGELVVRRIGAAEPFACSMRVTTSDNGITNAIEIYRTPHGQVRVLCSNNDDMVRAFDSETFQLVSQLPLPWAVNCTVMQPGSCRLLLTVGDDPTAHVYEAASGRQVAQLKGHLDYSFAAAWHPDGNVVATGNQDMTTRLWDLRYPATSFALLKAHIGAVRALRFSPDGRFLAAAEPADYVTLYDAAAGYQESQVIDLFGELAGISFTPEGDRFYASVSDVHYSSVLQFEQHRAEAGLWPDAL
ncbi:putative WD repeat-containing -like [Chlorella sorokiniana]|uniref:WD repeat-containing-like n=1 Tax=Chlorella sorokiniana TaxID=3076 RepID=A0A2P6TCQ6_CHLSO|nr:putative WD repeat-containing -like [Chlorella sorokiniana]|eukprot:PRW20425.1 putative WD repeat-containing -like [Chlorella sorokiniana]